MVTAVSYTHLDVYKRQVLTSAKASLESHLMAFAAEISRKEDKIVMLDELREDSGGTEQDFAV